MKGIKKIMIVVSAIAGLIVLSGCQKELFSRKGEIHNVKFGAKTHSFLGTRTEYGAYNNTDPNLATHQDINWVTGDQIRVYSPTASRRVGLENSEAAADLYYWADYSLTPNDDPTTATIDNLSNDGTTPGYSGDNDYEVGNGLAWVSGQEDTKHTFYAIYPNPGTDEGSGANLNGCKGKFNLSVEGPTQLFTPDAKHAAKYMTAVAKPNPASMSDNVELDFYPAFTAFEIMVRSADEAIALSSFKLESTSTALTGNYMVDYTNYNTTTQLPTYTCTGTGKSITVSLTGKSAPAASTDADLSFTILALPQDLTDLSVSFTTAAGITRKLALNYANGTPITFDARSKHRIYGLILSNGELLISVNTAPWLAGGIYTFTTIEDVTTFFLSYKRFNTQHYYEGSASWNSPYVNYIAVAPGRSTTDRVDPEDPESALTHLPLYSPMIELNTVSVGVPLELRSDNPNVGFVTAIDGVYSETPSQTLPIRASSSITDEVATSYFVVPLNDSAIGQVANISLVRTDSNTPIAFSHSDMPGTTDHTKVPYIVLSVDDYNNSSYTHVEIPSK